MSSWVALAILILGTSGVPNSSNHYSIAFFVALIQLVYGLPAILAMAFTELGFGLLQVKWRAVSYLLFIVSCLAILACVVGLFYGPGTENFAVLVYPAVAAGILYVIRSFVRALA